VLETQVWWGEIAANPAKTPGQGMLCDPQGRRLQTSYLLEDVTALGRPGEALGKGVPG